MLVEILITDLKSMIIYKFKKGITDTKYCSCSLAVRLRDLNVTGYCTFYDTDKRLGERILVPDVTNLLKYYYGTGQIPMLICRKKEATTAITMKVNNVIFTDDLEESSFCCIRKNRII